jgi:hypothetical protein
MVFTTVDFIYGIGFFIVMSSLFWPGANVLRFCALAVAHIAFGTLSICGVFPNLPTLTNNNYLVLTHGMLDILLFVMSIISYAFIVFKFDWWETE